MDASTPASTRVLATPELLELILLPLLSQLRDPLEREDPRSPKTRQNATVLLSLLALRATNRTFSALLTTTSPRLRRALFLAPAHPQPAAGAPTPPLLNPIAQTTFPAYHFRFWHLAPEASGNRYCAYLIVSRDDLRAYRAVVARGPKVLDRMLLAQPPAVALEARIWDERDETREYLGRTAELADPRIESREGLTVGEVHRRVGEMFDRHADVVAIKLTTV
ncbi:hypothetical protein WHR41_00373 [Cladosporium halotolerans]|uniref:Uncharacterized protein n=1 Tax=Cladosporium halotolerans TaxID=1052096 RepID=A0AB34L114_9PEZI